MNNTFKTIRLRRSYAIGHLKDVNSTDIGSVTQVSGDDKNDPDTEILSEIKAPENLQELVTKSIIKNADLFAKTMTVTYRWLIL